MVDIKLDICKKKYWNFIGQLRANPKVAYGFCETATFREEAQVIYMVQNSKYFHVALVEDVPVGYIGLIGSNRDEITYCVHPDYQGTGIGTFMVRELMQISPKIWAKVKSSNLSSAQVFIKLGFEETFKEDFLVYTQRS